METTKQIIVRIKNVYGKQTIYPVCELAALICSIAGKKTLTDNDIRLLKNAGYKIIIDQPQIEL